MALKSRAFLRSGSLRMVLNTTSFQTGTKYLDDSLRGVHSAAARKLAETGRRNLRASIERPQERGEGELRGRQTGNFTFGGSGAFVGTSFAEGDIQGFGWPNVQVADRRTNYVWRSLEWGLGGGATSSPFSPRGTFKLPGTAAGVFAFHFNESNVFRPGKKGRRLRLRGVEAPDSGIEPKYFLTNAWDEVVADEGGYLHRKYREVEAEVAKRL